MKHVEVDVTTGEVTERDYTPEEIAEAEEMAQRPTLPPADPNADPNVKPTAE